MGTAPPTASWADCWFGPTGRANPFGRATIASSGSRDAMVGLMVPFGGVQAFLASYINKDDRTAFDQAASEIALGHRYTLTKRTDVNIAIATMDNPHGASYTVGSATESDLDQSRL